MVTKSGVAKYLLSGMMLLWVLLLPGCVQGPDAPPPLLPPDTPAGPASATPSSPGTPAPPQLIPPGPTGIPASATPAPPGNPDDSVSPALDGTVPLPVNPAGPEPFIPGGVYHVGTSILFEGTTILSPGNPLLVEVRARSFGPTMKTDPDFPSGVSAVIEVREGSGEGQNTWQFLFDTDGMAAGDYSFEITGLEVRGFRSVAGFTLVI